MLASASTSALAAFTDSVYVSKSLGNDAYDGLAAVWDGAHGPKKTLDAAIGVIAARADRTATLRIRGGETYAEAGDRFDFTSRTGTKVAAVVGPAGAAPTIAPPSTQRLILINAAGVELSLTGLVMTSAYAGAAVYLGSSATDAKLTLDGCSYTKTAGYAGSGAFLYADSAAGATRELAFTDCTLAHAPAATDTQKPFFVWDAKSLRFTRCTITANANATGEFLYLRGTISDEVTFTDCAVTVNGMFLGESSYCSLGTIGGYTGRVIAVGNRITAGSHIFRLDRYVRRAAICDNALAVGNADKAAVMLGYDTGTNPAPFNEAGAEVVGNRVTWSGAAQGHGIVIGIGCNGATCAYNRVTNGAYGLVIKGHRAAVFHNTVHITAAGKAYAALHLSAGDNACVHHNTIVQQQAAAAVEIHHTGGDYAGAATVRDNVIVAGAAGGCGYAISAADEDVTHRIDHNLYWLTGGATALARFDGDDDGNLNTYATLAAARAAWAAFVGAWPDNDARSVFADPLLAADLRPRLRSPARLGSDWMNACLGAWQRGETSGRAPFWRLANPAERREP